MIRHYSHQYVLLRDEPDERDYNYINNFKNNDLSQFGFLPKPFYFFKSKLFLYKDAINNSCSAFLKRYIQKRV
jgi:hypothetical protein